jgi:6-phosphofructokinase 1
VQSPLRRDARSTVEDTFVTDGTFVRLPLEIDMSTNSGGYLFEKAGPHEKIFFDPAKTKAAIVTCGGLCPGLNSVIRSVYLQLHYHYGVARYQASITAIPDLRPVRRAAGVAEHQNG